MLSILISFPVFSFTGLSRPAYKLFFVSFKISSISSSDRSANLDVAIFVFSKRYTDDGESRDIRVQLFYVTNKRRASGQQIGPGPTDRKLLTFNRSLIHGFLDFKKKAFSTGTPVFSTNKNDRHDITEILLNVALR